MGKRGKKQIDEEDEQTNSKTAVHCSDNDEEDEKANEDLSLKIVEKALLMRAAKLGSQKGTILMDLGTQNGAFEGIDVARRKKKKEEEEKRKKSAELSATFAEEEEQVESAQDAEQKIELTNPEYLESSDNIVMKKLLRGPRYFDPPNSGWDACYNCGEEGHTTVNCTLARRRKPCFLCGSSDHGHKQCSKGHACFICKKSGHRAKDCPEKSKSSLRTSKICLKCGESGHDMFFCRNDYSLDDLKEIQCYICKASGHLSCAKSSDSISGQVSCYRCGQLGHTGLACMVSYGEGSGAASSSCYKCGEEGHFARECSKKIRGIKQNADRSAQTNRSRKAQRAVKSAPNNLGKAQKRKKVQNEERGTTPNKSKRRGGWIMDDAGDTTDWNPKKCGWGPWGSPSTPFNKGHPISTLTAGGQISSSKSPKRKEKFQYGTSAEGGSGTASQWKYSASRFSNLNSNGMRSYNYNW